MTANDDEKGATLVEVTVASLDNVGELLGVASTAVVNLRVGGTRDFTFDGYGLPVGCAMAVISDCDAIAVAAKH